MINRRLGLCLLTLVMLILSGCGEKRVEGPTAPPKQITIPTEQTEAPEGHLILPNYETEPTTMPTETIIQTIPETIPETVPAVTEEPVFVPVDDPGDKAFLPAPLDNPGDKDFVPVTRYLPNVRVDLQYAGPDNFTGQTIYDFREAYLRYGTVKKLEAVCRELEEQGLYLKIWDAFRPEKAQYTLWEACPDPNFVANPERGHSAHTRGNAVDVTLVDAEGRELEMPTEFDDFSEAANRDYSDCTETARHNAVLLETVMEKHGFSTYWGEWWHYVDMTKYEVETVFDPGEFSWWTPDCNEYITLRSKANARSEPVNRIAKGEKFLVLGFTGRFAMAQYMGQRGYVLYQYIQPVE